MPKPPETYGFNLQRLRAKSGLTQEELAAKIDTNRSVIARAEMGTSVPGARNRAKICEALKQPEDEFWRDPTEFNPQHERTEKVRAAVKGVLEAAGYRIEDLPELFGLVKPSPKKRADGADEDPEVKKDKALIDEYLVGKKKKKSAG